MKILLSSYQCVPNAGTELGNGWHWAEALTELGHEMTVLTQPSDIIRAAAPPGIEFLHVDAPDSALRCFTGPRGTLGHQLRWLNHYLRWQDAAFDYIKNERRSSYDVVHHVSWGSLRLGSGLWQLPTPLVYGPIGGGQTAPGDYWRYFGREWPLEMARALSTRPPLLELNRRGRDTIRNAAVVLVTNKATEVATRRLGARDVRPMLGEGLPGDWIADSRSRSTGVPMVLWVGSLIRLKAPTLAIQAFAELRRRTRARLVVAGDGPLLTQLQSMVTDLGLTQDVELLGRVPWIDMKPLYDSATAFLFTSLRDSYGAQFNEALGRGLPAVALDHHGIGDAEVGPAAIKVGLTRDPRDLPVQLANALLAVIRDEDWESRSAAGLAYAARHTWPMKAAEATRIYADVLGQSVPRQVIDG